MSPSSLLFFLSVMPGGVGDSSLVLSSRAQEELPEA